MTGGEAPVRPCPCVAVASLYKPDLVTRHTGRVVRLGIESLLDEYGGHTLTVLDFRDVTVIDFSCADEIVAKLVLSSLGGPAERFFVFRGIGEHHTDPMQCVLDRRRLTVAAERVDGERILLGWVEPEAERAWRALCRAGRAAAGEVGEVLGVAESRARALLDDLHGRRLLLRAEGEYVSLFRALAGATGGSGA